MTAAKRTKKDPSGSADGHSACIRFAREHYEQIRKEAKRVGQSFSTYVRTAAIEKATPRA